MKVVQTAGWEENDTRAEHTNSIIVHRIEFMDGKFILLLWRQRRTTETSKESMSLTFI